MKKAFTLMEVLVIMAVIGIISTMLIVNWRKNEKRYQLQRTAQEIVQSIRTAQDMALNSLKLAEEEIPLSYGVYFNKNINSSYVIFGDVNGNNSYQTPSSDILVEKVLIESSIEIDSLSPGTQDLSVVFSLPDGFTIITPPSTLASIVIKRKNGVCPHDCKTITIINTGQVNIE